MKNIFSKNNLFMDLLVMISKKNILYILKYNYYISALN